MIVFGVFENVKEDFLGVHSLSHHLGLGAGHSLFRFQGFTNRSMTSLSKAPQARRRLFEDTAQRTERHSIRTLGAIEREIQTLGLPVSTTLQSTDRSIRLA
ncbi:hypothetical protein Agabi119p4_1160 [Agaricus bisporus var. burnettii]|uniref:Uncharacterized protein n=1 Tax=Agaricus bisporus var. burnettii TaxID=192524 RepID=A0A8H7FBY0_AGABI|nr:hypothetical protein Agabi119p4_1160 [Agaricus bisporus var. burnettii]